MKDTKGVRQVLLDFGRAWHKAMPSAVGGLREARKAEAALQEIMLGMLPEEITFKGIQLIPPANNKEYKLYTDGHKQAIKEMEQNIRGGFNNG